MIFNEFRLTADLLHDFAILLLICNIIKTRSCYSISGVTVLLYLITFFCRYLDVIAPLVLSFEIVLTYNTIFKIYYILSHILILFLIYGLFRKTLDKSHDIFTIFGYLLCAFFLNWITCDFTVYRNIDLECLWQFSIYLEIFAIVPQLTLIYKQHSITTAMTYYLVMLGAYRGFYILNWIYRYQTENLWIPISFWCACVQMVIYAFFFVFIYPRLDKVNQSKTTNIAKYPIGIIETKESEIKELKTDCVLAHVVV